MYTVARKQYKIVLSENDNACERFQDTSDRIYSVDELHIGENAPAFHPNCECTMIPYDY